MFCSVTPSQPETHVYVLACRAMSLIVPVSHMNGFWELLCQIYLSESSQGIFSAHNACFVKKKKLMVIINENRILYTFQPLYIHDIILCHSLKKPLWDASEYIFFFHLQLTAGN